MQNTKKSLSHFLHFKENYLRAFRCIWIMILNSSVRVNCKWIQVYQNIVLFLYLWERIVRLYFHLAVGSNSGFAINQAAFVMRYSSRF